MNVWLKFGICAAIVCFSGSKLSHLGEIIADKSKLSKSWVSLVLLSIVTTSPQLVSCISSVTLHDLPDMAVGGVIGGCMCNMLIIGLLDVLSKQRPVSYMVHHGHVLSAGFGIILMGLVAIDILFGKHLPTIKLLHSIDPITIAFIVGFLLAIKLTFNFEKLRTTEGAEEEARQASETNKSWPKLIAQFLFYALCIVVAACYLPEIGDEIGQSTGWGQSFIGTSFIAIATSLPELSVSVSAARRGAFDMAVANLLGSTLFNIAILAVTDFFYTKEPLLHHVSVTNTLAALTAIISMGIVVVGLTYRAERKLVFMAGDAVALILVYIIANVLLFVAR